MNNTLIEKSEVLQSHIEKDESCIDNFFELLNIHPRSQKNILELVGKDLFQKDYNYKKHRI